jgi:hypothetical protein
VDGEIDGPSSPTASSSGTDPEIEGSCNHNVKEIEIKYAFPSFGRGGGSQFEGYPLPFSRLGSSLLLFAVRQRPLIL